MVVSLSKSPELIKSLLHSDSFPLPLKYCDIENTLKLNFKLTHRTGFSERSLLLWSVAK